MVTLCQDAVNEFQKTIMMEEGDSFVVEIINNLKDNLEDYEKLQILIEKAIDIQQAGRGEYMIKPSFSENLGILNDRIEQTKEKVEKLRKDTAKELGVDSDEIRLIDSGTHTFLFEVNKK
jgi:DNA mismatch repair ATPase MutS